MECHANTCNDAVIYVCRSKYMIVTCHRRRERRSCVYSDNKHRVALMRAHIFLVPEAYITTIAPYWQSVAKLIL